MNAREPFGVGIVGVGAERGWGRTAHVPALRAIDGFELRGLTASSPESAARAAAAHDVPFAGVDPFELASRPEIDLVVISVRVEPHEELVRAAAAAGKAILCEWPLAPTTAAAERMADLAATVPFRSAIGLQARSTPEVRYVRELVASGELGDVLSTTFVGSGPNWGSEIDAATRYTHDRATGATMIRIPFGHTLDAVQYVLGELTDVVAKAVVVQPESHVVDTGERFAKTSHDQLVVGGTIGDGAVLAAHYRGGASAGTGFRWEINGTAGDVVLTGPSGHLQFGLTTVHRATTGGELRPVEVRPDQDGLPSGPAASVAHAYLRLLEDLRDGGRRVPDFAHAVALHRRLDEIEAAAGIAPAAPRA